MAATTTLRVTVDDKPAQELITRVREAAAEALDAARQDGQDLTAETAVDTALGAALAAILRVRSNHEDAEAELARLREGEETTEGHDPAVEHSDGQWLYRFNRAPAAERLQVISGLRAQAARGYDCFLMGHQQRLADDQQTRETLARVRDLEGRLWENGDQELRPVSAVSHAIANDIRVALGEEQPAPGLRVQVAALRDDLREVTGARWIAEALDRILNPPPPVRCARCKDRGVVPDWTNWDAYHGEPKPKPCPDCQTEENTE